IVNTLENHYHDMQDMEFTIEEGKLYFLQTRNGKRTAQAALRIAVEMVEEGLVDKKQAILMMDPKQLDTLLHPAFDAAEMEKHEVVATGLPASPGAATGKIAFSALEAKERHERGEKCILVRQETSPEDIEGMIAAEGILTGRGGMTSHAAVVARGMGKCCVAGCNDIRVSESNKTMRTADLTLNEGDYISLDGGTGTVYLGEIDKVLPTLSGSFGEFMSWVDEIKTMGVRTNSDNPRDVKQALK